MKNFVTFAILTASSSVSFAGSLAFKDANGICVSEINEIAFVLVGHLMGSVPKSEKDKACEKLNAFDIPSDKESLREIHGTPHVICSDENGRSTDVTDLKALCLP